MLASNPTPSPTNVTTTGTPTKPQQKDSKSQSASSPKQHNQPTPSNESKEQIQQDTKVTPPDTQPTKGWSFRPLDLMSTGSEEDPEAIAQLTESQRKSVLPRPQRRERPIQGDESKGLGTGSTGQGQGKRGGMFATWFGASKRK